MKILSRIYFTILRIARMPVKTFFVLMSAVIIVGSLGWLQSAINRIADNIDRLYDSIELTLELGQADRTAHIFTSAAVMQEFIRQPAVDAVMNTGMVAGYYLEAGIRWNMLVKPNADGSFPDNVWEEVKFPYIGSVIDVYGVDYAYDWLVAPSCMETFIYLNTNQFDVPGVVIGDIGPDGNFIYGEALRALFFSHDNMYFLPGYGLDNFVYDDFTLQTPIPIIVYEYSARRWGFEVGDYAFLAFNASNMEPWQFKARIIGIFTGIAEGAGNISRANRHIVFLPLEAMLAMRRHPDMNRNIPREATYMTAQFLLDPIVNRNLDEFIAELAPLIRRRESGHVTLGIHVNDHLLRNMVTPMEENLLLMQLLYPIALVVAFLLSAGFTFLMMIGNAMHAAILRVLGTGKGMTRVLLGLEQFVICLVGAVIGAGIMLVVGFYLSDMAFVMLVGLYLSGALLGTGAGVVIISEKQPLDLLQVKE